MKYLLGMTLISLLWSQPARAGMDEILAGYQAAGASSFEAAAGKELWNRSLGKNEEGQEKSCTTCHGADPRQRGKHVKTGKEIDPMAPAVQKDRLTEAEKVEKWFKRNCTWTLGRECTPQEKGNILTFLRHS